MNDFTDGNENFLAEGFGAYHADNGHVKAIRLRDQGHGTDTIGVFSDGRDGSGISVGFTVLPDVPRGTATGQWTPPVKPDIAAPKPAPAAKKDDGKDDKDAKPAAHKHPAGSDHAAHPDPAKHGNPDPASKFPHGASTKTFDLKN